MVWLLFFCFVLFCFSFFVFALFLLLWVLLLFFFRRKVGIASPPLPAQTYTKIPKEGSRTIIFLFFYYFLFVFIFVVEKINQVLSSHFMLSFV